MPETIRIRCTQEVTEIFEEYRPEPGKVYDAIPGMIRGKVRNFVIVRILDKDIVLRYGEYEIVGV